MDTTTTTEKPTIERQIVIHAEPQRVWETMLDQESFKTWCAAFMPGSYFVGDWSQGSTMRFLGPNEDGTVNGMVTKIVENEPYRSIKAEHIGVVDKNQDRFEGEDFEEWIPCHEEYRFEPVSEGTSLTIRTTVPERFREMFETSWDNALAKLKQIVETA